MIKSLLCRAVLRAGFVRVVLAGCCALGCLSIGLSYGAEPAGPTPDPGGQSAARAARFVEVAATPETLRQLRAGGYALYLRHGATDNSKPDRVPAVDLADCSTQRPLTEAGRQMAAGVGSAMRQARIPIGEFRVSPLCRARDSAAAAFPNLNPVVDNGLMYLANFTQAEKAPIIAHTRLMLSTVVPPGSNRLLLAHAPNLMELIGYFPSEGTLVVFRPQGDGRSFDYIASIAPTHWGSLLK